MIYYILVFRLIGTIIWLVIMGNVEKAQYTVVEAHDPIEIRDYPPQIVAEAQVSGNRKDAINQGFKIIADYIFGNNTCSQKIAMTAPVTQQKSQKIGMTAPVTQPGAGESWLVRFIMPSRFTLQTLPQPTNSAVKVKAVSKGRYAVIRFSGIASEQSLKKYTLQLNLFIQAHHLVSTSEPIYAFFNPPWTLPFLRHNEIMLEIGVI